MRSFSNLSLTRSLKSNKRSTSSLRDTSSTGGRPLTPTREVQEPGYKPSPPDPPRIDLSFDDGPNFSLANLFASDPSTSYLDPSELQSGAERGGFEGHELGESSKPTLSGPNPEKVDSAPSPVDKALPALPVTRPESKHLLHLARPPLNTQSTTSSFSEAAHSLAPLTPAVAREETLEDQSTLPQTLPSATVDPPVTLSSPSEALGSVDIPSNPTNTTSLQHSLSLSAPPPDYSTLSPSASGSGHPWETLSPQAVANKNNEKQALRDTWAKQDAERQAAVALAQQQTSYPPVSYGPPSGSGGQGPFVQGFEPGRTGDSGSASGSSGQGSRGTPGSINVLPPGMDIRDALAKCEDPSLGWSLQFWVTIADPQVSDP